MDGTTRGAARPRILAMLNDPRFDGMAYLEPFELCGHGARAAVCGQQAILHCLRRKPARGAHKAGQDVGC